jgi:small subunit ribosomal protein S6
MAETKHTYELTYIVNAVLSDDQIKSVVERVDKYISEHDGEILQKDEWGSRRLSYPINKKRNGYYVNLYFKAPGDIVSRFERSLQIDDDILRYLTLRMDAKMLRRFEQHKEQGQKIAETN